MSKILVIEDEQDVRDNIVEILELEGFETKNAKNGIIGLKLAQQYNPDIIICDILMPIVNGYEVLDKLRKNPKTALIPFIFLTAKATSEDLRRGMDIGADDYLTKPFKIDTLLKVVQIQLEKKEASKKPIKNLLHDLTFKLPHELFTPLTPIIGFSKLLYEEEYLNKPEEIKSMAKSIHTSALRLERLMGNYLLYADLLYEKHQNQMILEENLLYSFRHKEILYFIKKKMKSKNREKDLIVTLDTDTVTLPAKSFRKILEEILDNAIKFSKPGDSITVSTTIDKDNFIMKVIDQGIVFKKEQISRIGAFVQFDRDIHEQQGLGLGLFLVQQLLKNHKGTLSITSGTKRGIIVKITLPLFPL